MQIVIELDDGMVQEMQQKDFDYARYVVRDFQATIADAIRNGTPLPKGHGRMGDLDELEKEMDNGIKAGLMIEGYEEYSNINGVDDCLECVKYADTIIEADKTESEEK